MTNRIAPPTRVSGASISPELVGLWRHNGKDYEISSDGFFYTFQAPRPYSLNEPTLDWSGWIFERIMGNSGGLVGLWRDPSTGEEVLLRSNHSLTWYDPSGWQLFGSWSESSSPQALGTSEARAFLIENGNTLTFDLVYAGQQVYEFTVTTTTLTLTDPVSGAQVIYTR